MRQILIVANQTVGSDTLAEAIRTRMAAGPCQFVLLVPATERRDYSSAALAVAGAEAGAVWARQRADAPDPTRNRLREGLGWLHHLGAATAKGEVGDKNPMHAIRTSLQRHGREFDEIIISTLPTHISRWLRMDLPQRAKREFGLPVTVVTAQG
jgi:GABA permease